MGYRKWFKKVHDRVYSTYPKLAKIICKNVLEYKIPENAVICALLETDREDLENEREDIKILVSFSHFEAGRVECEKNEREEAFLDEVYENAR